MVKTIQPTVYFKITQGAMKKNIVFPNSVVKASAVLAEIIRNQAPFRGEMVLERMTLWDGETPINPDHEFVARDATYDLQLVLAPTKGKSKSSTEQILCRLTAL
jgi:hypothetical protein